MTARTPHVIDLRSRLLERLAKLGVEHHPFPDRDDGFAALSCRGKPFAHFHSDRELDIRLTRAVIAREGLVHPPGSTVHPNRTKTSHWIEVRFATAKDLDRVIRLIKLAIDQL